MIEICLKYDNMHIFGIINAFNCINNYVINVKIACYQFTQAPLIAIILPLLIVFGYMKFIQKYLKLYLYPPTSIYLVCDRLGLEPIDSLH